MKRTFITGSEWLYYKIYTGHKTADRILSEVIKPVSEKLLEEGIIDSWFFVRYSDPKIHIRVRFHHTQTLQLEETIFLIHNSLTPFVDYNLIWKIMTDTYNRELERYGIETINEAEQLFFYDSQMIVNMLCLIKGDEGEVLRWQIGLKVIDEMLNSFGFNDNEKLHYLTKLRDTFGLEFGMSKDLKNQLSNKYRKERKVIENVMSMPYNLQNKVTPLFSILEEKTKNIIPIVIKLKEKEKAGIIEIPIDQLMNSYLHMTCNRLFKSKQRLHELVLYDFLCQYYISQLARKNK